MICGNSRSFMDTRCYVENYFRTTYFSLSRMQPCVLACFGLVDGAAIITAGECSRNGITTSVQCPFQVFVARSGSCWRHKKNLLFLQGARGHDRITIVDESHCSQSPLMTGWVDAHCPVYPPTPRDHVIFAVVLCESQRDVPIRCCESLVSVYVDVHWFNEVFRLDPFGHVFGFLDKLIDVARYPLLMLESPRILTADDYIPSYIDPSLLGI